MIGRLMPAVGHHPFLSVLLAVDLNLINVSRISTTIPLLTNTLSLHAHCSRCIKGHTSGTTASRNQNTTNGETQTHFPVVPVPVTVSVCIGVLFAFTPLPRCVCVQKKNGCRKCNHSGDSTNHANDRPNTPSDVGEKCNFIVIIAPTHTPVPRFSSHDCDVVCGDHVCTAAMD